MNKVILEGGKPKIVLSENHSVNGHVSIGEAKRLAKIYAREIIKRNTGCK